MVYTSPNKVAWIVELKNIGQSDYKIARWFNLHRTTIPHLIKRFAESGDPYFRKYKPDCPRRLQEHDPRHGTILLACTEAANVARVTKMAFPHVSRPTISLANVAKRKAWAAAHADWTVEDWK
ncbi:hypothetical protein EDB87DRAFT_1684585 [Lactarius vividus]|nr:hypothetical protein EDB87DRAFT_1684585 [Lactarius vividus]